MILVLFCLCYMCSFSGHLLLASKKTRRAWLSLRVCGFKHFIACNLGLVCLIVIGLGNCRVSRVGRFSFSSVKSSYLLFSVNTIARVSIQDWFIMVWFCV